MERIHLVRLSRDDYCRRSKFIVKCGICGDTRVYENEDGARLSINRPDPKSKPFSETYAILPEEWVPLFELVAGFNWSYDGNLRNCRSEKCPNCHTILYSGYIPGSFIHDFNLDLEPTEKEKENFLVEKGYFSEIQERIDEHLEEYKSDLIYQKYHEIRRRKANHIKQKKKRKFEKKQQRKAKREAARLDRYFKDVISKFDLLEYNSLADTKFLHRLPLLSGIYIMYDMVKTPVYVGQSKNLKNRLLSHKDRFYDVTHVRFIPLDELKLDFVEYLLISKLKPIHNKR
jgi:hypothetical protein